MPNLKKHRTLITGGAGFIGTHLCRTLISQGYDVSVLDLRAPSDPVPGVHYHRGDVRDSATVDFHIKQMDVVFHLAAIVSVPVCQMQPLESYSTNFGGTLTILESIRQKKATTGTSTSLVFASTAAVYGHLGTESNAMTEEAISEPFLSFYAAQKHASEQAIRLFQSVHGIPCMIYRFFNVYGTGQDPTSPYSGVITIFLERAKKGLPLTIFGNGENSRDFVEVRDLCKVVSGALTLPVELWTGAPVNIGTGNRTSLNALATEIIKQFPIYSNQAMPIQYEPPRSGDVVHSLANIQRLRSLFPHLVFRPFATGLAELISNK